MIYLILLTIYLLSAFAMYKWIQIAFYHKNGVLNGDTPESIDLFFTFCPILNTIAAISHWCCIPCKNTKPITNFFKPKNYDKNP